MESQIPSQGATDGKKKPGTSASTGDIGFADDVIRAQAQPGAESESVTGEQTKQSSPSVTEFSREKLQAEQAFTAFRNPVSSKEKLLEFNKAIDRAFALLETQGVLEKNSAWYR